MWRIRRDSGINLLVHFWHPINATVIPHNHRLSTAPSSSSSWSSSPLGPRFFSNLIELSGNNWEREQFKLLVYNSTENRFMISGDYVTIARWGEHQQLPILWGGCVCVYIGSCSLYFRAPHRIAAAHSVDLILMMATIEHRRQPSRGQTGSLRRIDRWVQCC